MKRPHRAGQCLMVAAGLAGFLAFGNATALAQMGAPEPNPSHRSIPLMGGGQNLNAALRERLSRAEQSALILDLFRKGRDPEFVEEILENPERHREEVKALEALVKSFHKGGGLPIDRNSALWKNIQVGLEHQRRDSPNGALGPELLKQLEDIGKQVPPTSSGDGAGQPGETSRPENSDPNASAPGSGGAPPQGQSAPTAEPPASRMPAEPPFTPPQQPRFNRWLVRQSEWLASHSQALQNSPTLRHALDQLTRVSLNPNRVPGAAAGSSAFKSLARHVEKVLPSRQFLDRSILSKVRRIPLPSFGGVQWPRVELPKRPLPSISLPSVSAPPSAGPRPELTLAAVAGVALAGVLLWKLYQRRFGRSAGPEWIEGGSKDGLPAAWRDQRLLGRADLIRAFEHLSLRELGPEARSWNHLTIARSLGGVQIGRRRAADHLAALYEQARYAPADESLPEGALQVARRELSFLAGVRAA